METRIAVFKRKDIRKILFQNERYFFVVDIVAAFTDSENPRDYWSCPYPPLRRNRSSAGWPKSATNACRKSKTQNWEQSELGQTPKQADPKSVFAVKRGNWSIENSYHYIID